MKKVLIINCGSSKVPEIEKLLTSLSIQFTTVKLNELVSVNEFSRIIISGAPILLTNVDPKPFLDKAKIIFSNQNLPILGICFGHQLMGLFHNATVSMCNESRSWEEITFSSRFELINKHKSFISFMEDHCECISLPENFTLIASSNTCKNEVMKHINNPWFGVQFHPEVSGEIGRELIANFIALRRET